MADHSKASNDDTRGPLGDARPDAANGDELTPGGQPAEKPEDRPNVGKVKPEDYPEQA